MINKTYEKRNLTIYIFIVFSLILIISMIFNYFYRKPINCHLEHTYRLTFSDNIAAISDTITFLPSLILSIATISLSLSNETIFGIRRVDFYKIKSLFSLDISIMKFIIMITVSLIFSIVSISLKLIIPLILVDVFVIIISIKYAFQEIPILSNDDEAKIKVIKKYYKEFHNPSDIKLLKYTKLFYDVLNYLSFYYGIDELMEFLNETDE